jgi:hypothetical protein
MDAHAVWTIRSASCLWTTWVAVNHVAYSSLASRSHRWCERHAWFAAHPPLAPSSCLPCSLARKKKSSWPCLLAPRPNTRQFWPSLANTYGVPSLVQQPWQAIAVIELPKQHGIPSAPYLKPVMPRAPVELPRSRLTVDTTQCGIPASGEDL